MDVRGVMRRLYIQDIKIQCLKDLWVGISNQSHGYLSLHCPSRVHTPLTNMTASPGSSPPCCALKACSTGMFRAKSVASVALWVEILIVVAQ